MRTLKELYELVRLELIETKGPRLGICFAIKNCYKTEKITREERDFIQEDFRNRQPGIFNRQFYCKSYKRIDYITHEQGDLTYHWWRLNDTGYEQRLRFLKKIIDSL